MGASRLTLATRASVKILLFLARAYGVADLAVTRDLSRTCCPDVVVSSRLYKNCPRVVQELPKLYSNCQDHCLHMRYEL